MRNVLTAVLVLFLSVSLFAQSDLEKFVQKTQDTFKKAMETNQGELVLELYANDAISMPSYEPMIKGMDALKKKVEMDKQMPMKILSFEMKVIEIAESGEYGYEIGTYTMSMEMPGMDKPWDDKGKYITIYKKYDGKWKIQYDTWNTDVNPWMQMDQAGEEKDKKDSGKM
ncbi:MAG: hypothetical protein SCALA702_05220 [Melioribacteraceae bacterium]|nr:MAG: hypothetical protein SCALA702_05220 [Melioribacteraceae bacterium]